MFKQELLYKISDREYKLKYLKNTVIQLGLLNQKKPLIIYTGTNRLPLLNPTNRIANKKTINRIKKHGLDIYLYEPMSLYYSPARRHNRGYYSELPDNADKVLRSDELDSIEEYAVKHNLTNVTVYTGDYDPCKLLNTTYAGLNIKTCDLFLHSLSISYSSIDVLQEKQVAFWCLNGRYTLPRHIIMAYLIQYSGKYSWHQTVNLINLIAFDKTPWDEQWFDFTSLTVEQQEKIKNGNNKLLSTTFYVDEIPSKDSVTEISQCAIPNKSLNSNSSLVFQLCNQAFVAVVNETRFAQPLANISEKTLHAIAAGQPFILAAPPLSLEYLKKLGFKTFEDFWDESYDQEKNHTERLKKLFNVFDQIGNITSDEMRMLNKKMFPILEYNQRRLRHFLRNPVIL